jgi:hypothetical protein
MELGNNQLQIFVSLVVILGAACVALICDFLKGNNEQLRESFLELKVRLDEVQRRNRWMDPRFAGGPAARPVARREDAGTAEAPVSRRAVQPQKRAASADALAAMERGARLAGSRSNGGGDRSSPAPAVVVVESAVAGAGAAPASKNWGLLLDSSRARKARTAETQVNENLLEAVVAATASSNLWRAEEGPLPAGLQETAALRKLLESGRTVSGLVVSIGVSGAGETDAPELRALMQSVAGPDGFAAPAGPGEFVLICPKERGSSAQRRLKSIAEQLWVHQLRSLASSNIRFSWGGLEVRGEAIREAVAAANERMLESQRGRAAAAAA